MIFIRLKKLFILSLITTLSGCISVKNNTSDIGDIYFQKIPAKKGKKLLVSDSNNYALWFSKSTNRKNLPIDTFMYMMMTDYDNNVINWIEYDSINDVEQLLLKTDYNKVAIGGPKSDAFCRSWNAEFQDNESIIVSDEIENVNGQSVRFILLKSYHIIQESKSEYGLGKRGYLGLKLDKYYLHAIIEKGNYVLDIFMPAGGMTENPHKKGYSNYQTFESSLKDIYKKGFDKTRGNAIGSIIYFIENFLEIKG